MGLAQESQPSDEPTSAFGGTAARCWALLLTRICECLPLLCPHCSTRLRIIAIVLDPPTIERILRHIDQPHEPPAVLPARSPPQAEFAIGDSRDCVAIQFNQDAGVGGWSDLDQTVGEPEDSWD